MARWESVTGLEVQMQLDTRSKFFSGVAKAFGAPPNPQACPVDLGLPGVLPVLNVEAVRRAVLFGLAVEGDIAQRGFADGLPVGLQLIGPHFAEDRLLALGEAYQQDTDWHLEVPASPSGDARPRPETA